MLPKTHLTWHSRMSSSGWVTTPSWLSRSLRPFLYSSSVYSCHLFLIFLLLLGPFHFCPLYLLILAWNVPLISPVFLKRSLVFPILLFSSVAFFSLLAVILNSVFPFSCFLSYFVTPPQTTTLSCCISFSLGWFWSLTPVQCCKPPYFRHSVYHI